MEGNGHNLIKSVTGRCLEGPKKITKTPNQDILYWTENVISSNLRFNRSQ